MKFQLYTYVCQGYNSFVSKLVCMVSNRAVVSRTKKCIKHANYLLGIKKASNIIEPRHKESFYRFLTVSHFRPYTNGDSVPVDRQRKLIDNQFPFHTEDQ